MERPIPGVSGDALMSPSLNLLVLRCTDIEVTAKFYRLLGFDFSQHQHGKGPKHFANEANGFVLELYPATDGRADNAALGFATDDLEATRQQLAEAGFVPSEIRDEPWGRVCVVRDPDFRRVELKQR